MRKVLAALLLAFVMLAGLSEMAGCKSGQASRRTSTRKVRKAKPKPAATAPARTIEEDDLDLDDDLDNERDTDLDIE